ncbi:hypothetical protein AB8B21_18275 [Tardiphaga sp. 866_E4_N2_1]|uniref:hypothetical protein n=1 Tax=unclassified Tardiphaga TaxID=2631404 RepID=UPI003F27AFC4
MHKSPTEYCELYGKVNALIGTNRNSVLIGLDGRCGAGKSTLASWLAWQFGMPAIHLDLFLSGKDPLRWKVDDITRCLTARGDRPLIIESILLLDVLRQVGRKADFLVFVEQIDGSTRVRPPDSDDRNSPHSVDGQVDAYIENEAPATKANLHLRWG